MICHYIPNDPTPTELRYERRRVTGGGEPHPEPARASEAKLEAAQEQCRARDLELAGAEGRAAALDEGESGGRPGASRGGSSNVRLASSQKFE